MGMVVMMLSGSRKLSKRTPMIKNTKVTLNSSAIRRASSSSSSTSERQLLE